MEKINIIDDITKHDDAAIIEFLTDEVGRIRMAFISAIEKEDPALVFTTKGEVEIAYGVLRELNRRNKEKAV